MLFTLVLVCAPSTRHVYTCVSVRACVCVQRARGGGDARGRRGGTLTRKCQEAGGNLSLYILLRGSHTPPIPVPGRRRVRVSHLSEATRATFFLRKSSSLS